MFVHLNEPERAAEVAERYGLKDVPFINDPDRRLYKAFGLGRGGLGLIFGPKVLMRGFRTVLIDRHGLGMPSGDVRQMPGVFLVHRGRILRSFVHKSSADRPDYVALAKMPRQDG